MTVQNEFEQLLEALWAGRLGEAGRRRLEALCAAEPVLAARYREEHRLNRLLGRCGPNHAPADLARSVMVRLETRVHVRSARPWYAWFFQPAVRTALACTALVAVGIQVGLLINRHGNPSSAPSSASRMQAYLLESQQPRSADQSGRESVTVSPPAVPRQQIPSPAMARVPRERSLAMRPPSSPRVLGTPAPTVPASPYTLEEFPTGSEQNLAAGERFGGSAAFPDVIRSMMEPLPQPQVPAPAAPTPKPASPFPAVALDRQMAQAQIAGEKGALSPLNPADREVAMRITLNPQDLPPAARQGTAADTREKPVPFAQSFVPPQEARPKVEGISHKQIEYSVTAVGGELVSTEDVTGRGTTWQVKALMNPTQFRQFTAELRQYGIQPNPSLLTDVPAEAETLKNQPPSSSRNHYDIQRGRQWLKPLLILAPAAQSGSSSASAARTVVPAEKRRGAGEKLEVRITIEQLIPSRR